MTGKQLMGADLTLACSGLWLGTIVATAASARTGWVEDIVGTLMFMPLIYPFEPWRIKHNVHHTHTNKCASLRQQCLLAQNALTLPHLKGAVRVSGLCQDCNCSQGREAAGRGLPCLHISPADFAPSSD